MVEKTKDEQEFLWVPNCYGFIQKRLANESTQVDKFNPDKPMKQESVFMPKDQLSNSFKTVASNKTATQG